MNFTAGKASEIAAEEADEPVRVPIPVADPAAFVKNAAGHTETSGGRERLGGFKGSDFGAELRGKFFVSIEAENPGVRGEFQEFIFLAHIAEPGLVEKAGPELGGDLGSGVCAAGVEDDKFVGEIGGALKATRKVGLFVEGYDGERELQNPGGGNGKIRAG